MPYYCNYGGAGGFTSPTLGNLITGSPKVKVVIDKFSFVGNDSTQRVIFWQGGLTASLRELVFRKNGTTDYQLIVGGTVTSVMTNAEAATLYGSSAMTCDEWAVELDGTTIRMYKDGAVVKTVTGISRGTGRLVDGVFRIGCAPQTDTPANLASQFFAGANSTYGDIQIYVNDSLVRSYITPSAGTTIPDPVGGNTASQTGTWPAGDGEWVFYSSGATAYTDTLLAGSYAHSGSLLSSAVGYSSALQTGSFTHSGSDLSSAIARSSTLLAGSYTHSGSALGSAAGYSSTLQGGAFSYSGSELQSIIQNGAQNYSDTLLGGSFTHSGSALQSFVARNSTLLAGLYSHSGSSLSASLAFYSTLNGGSYSHFGSMLQSTISGQVTVSIEGYTITFAADDVSGAFAADMVGGSYQSDYIEAIKWLI